METATITSAPSAGAETASAAPAESYTPSSAPSADVYFQMAQNATRETPAQPNVPDMGASVPTTGEVPAEASQQAQANPEETQPAAITPEAEEQALREAFEAALPEDVKMVFKDKPWLRTAYYQARGMREVGWTLNGLRNAARAGLTEASFGELNSMFPTLDDARRTSQLAASMQSLQNDFTTNPEAFVQGMFKTDPEAAKRVVKTLTGSLPQLDSESYINTVSSGVQRLFGAIEAEAAGLLKMDPESQPAQDLQIALKIIRDKVFPGGGQDAAQAQQKIDPAIERELNELRGKEQAYRQQQTQAYQQEIYNRSVSGLEQFVDKLFTEANPSGLSEKGSARVKQEAMQAIGQDFMNNPVVRADLDRMVRANAPMDQVMNYIGSRLASLAPRRVAEALRTYTQDFFVKPQATAQPRQPVPAPRDVGAVGGSVKPIDNRGEFKPVPGIPYEEQMARWFNG